MNVSHKFPSFRKFTTLMNVKDSTGLSIQMSAKKSELIVSVHLLIVLVALDTLVDLVMSS